LIESLSSDGSNLIGSPLNPSHLPEFIDLISARTEFYSHPTALPTVQRGSIKLDLHRRDFTINTLALRLDGYHYGTLYDFWGGLNDLRQGLVRSLHSLSFVDDPTRMLRAVRFEQRFDFRIEERTLQLLKEAIQLIDRVSGDRIRHELDHIFDEEKTAKMLARLNELQLLSAIHQDLKWDDWIASRIAALS
jgi:tRNA nucleotidyltransferase (CCA-adding enzyme)